MIISPQLYSSATVHYEIDAQDSNVTVNLSIIPDRATCRVLEPTLIINSLHNPSRSDYYCNHFMIQGWTYFITSILHTRWNWRTYFRWPLKSIKGCGTYRRAHIRNWTHFLRELFNSARTQYHNRRIPYLLHFREDDFYSTSKETDR